MGRGPAPVDCRAAHFSTAPIDVIAASLLSELRTGQRLGRPTDVRDAVGAGVSRLKR